MPVMNGMLRLLMEEYGDALSRADEVITDKASVKRELSIVTGRLAYPYILRMAEGMEEMFPNLKLHVYAITNDFFGEMITVSGLLTGQDIIAQLQGVSLGERILLPQNVLRSGEEVFLDDVTLTEMKNALHLPIDIVKSSGYDFVSCILGIQI